MFHKLLQCIHSFWPTPLFMLTKVSTTPSIPSNNIFIFKFNFCNANKLYYNTKQLISRY
jgi:hypothetical protein